MKKIDVHIHSINEVITFNNSRIPTPQDLAEIVFPESNTEKGILLPLSNMGSLADLPLTERIDRGNELAYELTKQYPHMLDWFFYMDPTMAGDDPEADLSAYFEKYKAWGAKGVGELTTNLYFDDPLYINLFAHCERYELPILFHISPEPHKYYGVADDPGLPRLEKMLQKFPKLIFIGHSQPFWSEISADISSDSEIRNSYPEGKVIPGRVVELLRTYPNLYADLSAGSGFNALNRDREFAYSFLEEFQDKLMFGTDYVIPRIGIELSAFLDEAAKNGNISEAAYHKIIRLNAMNVLKLA